MFLQNPTKTSVSSLLYHLNSFSLDGGTATKMCGLIFKTDDDCCINDEKLSSALLQQLPKNNKKDPQPRIKPPPYNYWGLFPQNRPIPYKDPMTCIYNKS